MSNVQFGSFGQAARVLDIVSEQKLSTQEVEVLNAGYLSDLARAVKLGLVPPRAAFQKFLGLLPEFKSWKTVTLGVHKTAEAYRAALGDGFRISEYAGNVLDSQTPIASAETEVDLVIVTPAELGFTDLPTYGQICDRAIELGLAICPREVGPALRLAYPDQPFGEWLRVAMKEVADSLGNRLVFYVGHGGGGPWLGTRWFEPQSVWRLGDQFVFMRPRK